MDTSSTTPDTKRDSSHILTESLKVLDEIQRTGTDPELRFKAAEALLKWAISGGYTTWVWTD
jgi:hypothetical protein